MTRYEPIIGLEVHAQLATRSKIFCGCRTAFGAPPNSQVCPVCLGHPGVLPVLNREAVTLSLKVALAIGATVHPVSVFARKNYFYPDLPKGYQISQYDRPICTGGHLEFPAGESTRRVRFHRIHLEEDAGKSIHPEKEGEPVTRLDLNRCGTPLLEIVTEPDLASPEEAHAFLSRLKQVLLYLEVNDGNMEEGSLRCDANVSVRPEGETALGTKAEIKNLNSFRNVERGLAYEIDRQIRLVESGDAVRQETRLWDADRGVTRSMRSKEEAHDYRYFPEPDLTPLVIDASWIEAVRAGLPELPGAREARFEQEYGIPAYDARVLASDRRLADYYEEAAAESGDGKLASNWVMTEVLRHLKDHGDPRRLKVTGSHLGRMLKQVTSGAISGKIGKTVFEEMAATGKDPERIIEEKGLSSISDAGALEVLVAQVIDQNPDPVSDYLNGKEASFQFLIGQAMKASRGRADPKALRERFVDALQNLKKDG